MSFKKATRKKRESRQAGSMAIPAFLAVFISLSGAIAAPMAQAQTTSNAPHLDSNGWTVFTRTPISSGNCLDGTANGTCIFYVSDSDGNDCNDGLSAVGNPRGCGAGP